MTTKGTSNSDDYNDQHVVSGISPLRLLPVAVSLVADGTGQSSSSHDSGIFESRDDAKPQEGVGWLSSTGTTTAYPWHLQKKHQTTIDRAISTAADDDLMSFCLSGEITMKDLRDLEKRLEISCVEKSELESRVKELLKRKSFTKKTEERENEIQRKMRLQLLELLPSCSRRVELESRDRFDVELWDDIRCGFTLQRELQSLLQKQSQQNKKEQVITSLYDRSTKENGKLKESLEAALSRLSYYTGLVDEMNRKHRLHENKQKERTPIDEVKMRIAELDIEVKRVFERLVDEQMQREIDRLKTHTLTEGLKKRVDTLLADKKVYQVENGVLKERIEELLEKKKELTQEKLELQQRLDATREALENGKKEISKLEKQSERFKEALEKLTLTVEKLNKEIQQLDTTLLLREKEIKDLETMKFDLETKVHRLENAESIWQKTTGEIRAENRELHKELNTLTSEKEQLMAKVTELEDKLRGTENSREKIKIDLGKSLLEERNNNATLRERIETLTNEFDEFKKQSDASRDEQHHRNQHLQNQLHQKEEALAQQRSRRPALSTVKTVRTEFLARRRRLQLDRLAVRVEHRPLEKPRLSQRKTQSVTIQPHIEPHHEIPSKPPPKEKFTATQLKLLKDTQTASRELLKRKPMADELASVATTGAQQLRGSSSPPRLPNK